jgi:hypothetical protein
LYKFALHSEESTLPWARLAMNLVHLSDRISESPHVSPAEQQKINEAHSSTSKNSNYHGIDE